MGRFTAKKPSPAMIVSIVALVLAAAGTSVAGVATISVLNKKEKKQTRNIAKDEINKAAPGLSVASATNAQNATNASNADKLDGSDSGDFAKTLATTVDLADENAATDLLTLPGFGVLTANLQACETQGGSELFLLGYRNTLSTSVDLFTELPSSVASTTIAPGLTVSSGNGGDTTLVVHRIRPQDSAGRAATVTVFSRNVGATCRVSIQAVLTG